MLDYNTGNKWGISVNSLDIIKVNKQKSQLKSGSHKRELSFPTTIGEPNWKKKDFFFAWQEFSQWKSITTQPMKITVLRTYDSFIIRLFVNTSPPIYLFLLYKRVHSLSLAHGFPWLQIPNCYSWLIPFIFLFIYFLIFHMISLLIFL